MKKELPVNPNGLAVIVGPTGSGKSMFQTQLIGRALAQTTNTICTNVPIRWAELEEVTCELYGTEWLKNGSVRQRIYWTENQKEIRRFWLCRGFGWYVVDIEEEAYEMGLRPDYSVHYRWKEATQETAALKRRPIYQMRLPEVLRYVEAGEIEMREGDDTPEVDQFWDEGASFFPQLSKRKLGEAYRHALEHKRKLRGNFWIACQFPKQMDSELREQTNMWIYLTSFAHRRKGIFYLPKQSVWQQYPTMPRDHDKPDLSGYFAIDGKTWGRAYDTAAGVGLAGGHSADSKRSVGGISWMWFFPAVGLAIFAVMLILKWANHSGGPQAVVMWVLGRGGATTAVPQVVAKTQVTNDLAVAPIAAPASEFSKELAEIKKLIVDAKAHGMAPDRIGLTGFGELRWRNELVFYFADGSEGSSHSRHFGGAIREGDKIVGVIWENREYRLGDWSSRRDSEHQSDSLQSRMVRGS